jgi:hypothetical protein
MYKLTLEGGELLRRFSRVEAEEFSEFGAVLGVLMDTELDVLAKGFGTS